MSSYETPLSIDVTLDTGEETPIRKTITFARASDKTLYYLIRALDITLSTDQHVYVLSPAQNTFKEIQTDKEVANLTSGAELKIMTAKEYKNELTDRTKTEERIKDLVKKSDQTTAKIEVLKQNYLYPYKAGTISLIQIEVSKSDDSPKSPEKQSPKSKEKEEREVESWNYLLDLSAGKGIVTQQGQSTEKPLCYTWDGHLFLPGSNSLSHGGGQWNGTTLGWFLKESQAMKISGFQEVLVSYQWNEKDKKYICAFKSPTSNLPEIATWKWSQKSSSGSFSMLKNSTNNSIFQWEWRVSGDVPPPVIMFLQLLRYARLAIISHPKSGSVIMTESQAKSVYDSLTVPEERKIRKTKSDGGGESFLLRNSSPSFAAPETANPNPSPNPNANPNPVNPNKTEVLTDDNSSTTTAITSNSTVSPPRLFNSPSAYGRTVGNEGYATIRFGRLRNWKKKYLVILENSNKLYVYKTSEDRSNGKEIDLTNCNCTAIMKNEEHCIVLRQPGTDIYSIRVNSKHDRDVWLNSLFSHGVTKSGIVKEGVLRSKERYWFVLTKETISYYENQEDFMQGKPPRGAIDLNNCLIKETPLQTGSIGRKQKFGFGIFQPNGKRYYLFTDSQAELISWMKLCNETVEYLRSSTKPARSVSRADVDAPPSAWELEEEKFLQTTDDPFTEPDSPENIIFLDPSEEKVEVGLQVRTTNDPPLIKAATLPKLIERLTWNEYSDTPYLEAFMMTFKTFTTPREFLMLLIKRFNMPKPEKLKKNEVEDFEKKRQIVRSRVANVIREWVKVFPEDFTQNKELEEKLNVFMNEILSKSIPSMANVITRFLQKHREGKSELKEENKDDFPTPILPHNKKHKENYSSDEFTIFDFDPEEVARQMCLIDFQKFSKIALVEFTNYVRAKKMKDKEVVAKNLTEMIRHFNAVSKWIATEIVLEDNLKKRIEVLSFFITVARKCLEMNNFSAVMATISALQNSGVFRLKQTFDGLSNAHKEAMENMHNLMKIDGNYKNFRKYLKTCGPPRIPYIGVFLMDMTFINDGNPDFTHEIINFSKRRFFSRVLREIKLCQSQPYHFQEVTYIQEIIISGVGLEESDIYNISVQIEGKSGVALKDAQSKSTISVMEYKDTVRERRKSTLMMFRVPTKGSTGSNEDPHHSNSLPLARNPSLHNVRSHSDEVPSTSSMSSTSTSASTGFPSKRAKKIAELKIKFFSAVTSGNIEKAQSLIAQGITLKNLVESNGQTPLHISAFEGHLQLTEFFLAIRDPEIGNPDVDAQDKGGWTALHYAASRSHLEICEMLLKFGASTNIENAFKNLPLHFLAKKRNVEIEKKKQQKKVSLEDSLYGRLVKMMIDKGADVNHQNNVGEAPLHLAASSGNEDGIKLLLKNKADPLLPNKSGDTPLACALNSYEKLPKSVIQILKEAQDTKQEKVNSNPSLGKEVKMDDYQGIFRLMQSSNGVPVKDHKVFILSYKNSFLGSELIDWMMQNLPVRSRDDACVLAQKLLDLTFMKTVRGPKAFKDSPKSMFQFNDPPPEMTLESDSLFFSDMKQTPSNYVAIGVDAFDFLKVLGVGLGGRVVLARKKDSGKLYALKVVDKHNLVEEGELEMLLSEKKVLQNDSPFLVHLNFSFQSTDYLFLAMDFLGGGNLSFHLKMKERFSELECQFVAAEIVLALEYLHSRRVVYRDLQPANVMFDRDGHVCLTDFGVAKILAADNSMMQTSVGMPLYAAPEVLEGSAYTKSVDWWSLGILIYQMLMGFTPFESEEDDIATLFKNILSSRILYPEDLVSTKAKSLIEALLQRNPKLRLDEIDEIKQHVFFTGIDWEALKVKKVVSPVKIEIKSDDDVSHFDYRYTNQSTDFIFKDPVLKVTSKMDDSKDVPGFEFSLHRNV